MGKQYDYFEPRDFENKRFFIFKNIFSVSGSFETNPNKMFSIEADLSTFTLFDKERDLFGYQFEIEPTFRFNDKLRMSYELSYQNNKGSRGFVDNINDDIIFGERDVVSIENGLSGAYNFVDNKFKDLDLNLKDLNISKMEGRAAVFNFEAKHNQKRRLTRAVTKGQH